MANEITALCYTKNQQQPVLCFTPTEVFSADNFGNYTHLWEISKPKVSAPRYVTQNPTGPVPPQQSNLAESPLFNETARMQSFGQYHGTTGDVYTVIANANNTYQWSKASVGVLSSERAITGSTQAIELGINIRFFATAGFTGNETWTFYVFRPAFQSGLYSRWQLFPYDNSLFFVNELNSVRFMNGQTINTFAWSTDDVPTGRHMAIFQEHLFVSEPSINGVSNPRTLMWSDLREFMVFKTQLHINEADQYTFVETIDSAEAYGGITGLADLNPVRIGYGKPRLLVYTAKAIWMIEYVGLPFVMSKDPLHDKIGSAFPYGLVASRDMHVFIAADNFYKLEKDGEAQPIGDRVFAAFMNELTENVDWRYKTYGYLDQVRREIWWVFCSKNSTGDFDRKVGYNYISDTWQFAEASEHSFLHCRLPVEQGLTIGDDTTEIGDSDRPIVLGGQTNYQAYRLYGHADRKVSYEVLDINQPVDLSMEEPSLTTGDIIYDPGKVVLVDGMYVHADYDSATCAGIEIAVSCRDGIEDPVIFKLPPKLWTSDLRENKFSWPREKGRVFRFRFTFKKAYGAIAVRKAEFFFWNEIVSGLTETAEK